MKTAFRVLLLLLLAQMSGLHAAIGQSNKDSGDIKTEKDLVEQLGSTSLLLTPLPVGPLNPINESVLQQQGNNNLGVIVQTGQNLRTTIVQVGQGNVAQSTVAGQGTASDIVQLGNQNRLDQQLTAVGQRNFSVEQQGNRNELRQMEAGIPTNYPTGYGVKMVGNGIRMEIKQGVAGTLP